MPLSDTAATAILNSLFGKTSTYGALASAPSPFLALLTAYPDPSKTGTTMTEISYTGYARVAAAAASWNAASGRIISNSAQINFGTMTAGAGGTVNSVAICDASTAGNIVSSGYLMNSVGTSVTSITFSAGVATVTTTGSHGLSVGNTVAITGTEQPEYGGLKYVASVPSGTTFTYAVTGSPATPATASSGNSITVYAQTTLAVSNNIQPFIPAGGLIVPLN